MHVFSYEKIQIFLYTPSIVAEKFIFKSDRIICHYKNSFLMTKFLFGFK